MSVLAPAGGRVAALAGHLVANNPSGEAAKSGPWGFAIILLLCIACYFLFKSMSRHLRRIREDFPTDAARPADRAAGTVGLPAGTSEGQLTAGAVTGGEAPSEGAPPAAVDDPAHPDELPGAPGAGRPPERAG